MNVYLSAMTNLFPAAPAVGTAMPAIRPSEEARSFLSLRRSANKIGLGNPGPTGDVLMDILNTATRVPDHRRMAPWRFIIFEGEARNRFGEEAARVKQAEDPAADAQDIEAARKLLQRAPTVIAVVSSPTDDGRTPVWEQELSAGALCYNLLLVANAAGWGGVWLSEWICFSEGINTVLGLRENERLAGFIYLGTPTMDPQERARPELEPLVTHW